MSSLPPLAEAPHRKTGSQLRPPAFSKLPYLVCERSEGLQSANFAEKHHVARAANQSLIAAQVPFLSSFARLLRCRKDLGQLAEVLGGCSEQEFISCTTWAS